MESTMKHLDKVGAETRELSIDELDAIAGGGFWNWVKHEMVAVGKAIGSALSAVEHAGHSLLGPSTVKITVHRQN